MNTPHSPPGPGSSQRTVGYEEAPPGGRPVAAVSGFEATIVGESAASGRPISFHTAALGATEAAPEGTRSVATLGAPASGGGPTAGPGGSPTAGVTTLLPRSTVLPRVELRDGQPFVLHSDRLRYQTRKKLGEGGVGEVHLALDNDIERSVAVKRLRPGLQGTSALSRFVEEIRTVGQLEHPGIVPVHDVGLDEEGQFYFVMKYVDGQTLEQLIEKLAAGDAESHRHFPFERRVEIFKGILEAMAYAHDRGIVHRDLKPANIMVGPYGEVVVMDWGLAKKVGQPSVSDLPAADEAASAGDVQRSHRLHETRVGSLLGTPFYMSPEQARGQHSTLDQRSDIYSLSVLFHEFLLLRHLLHGRSDLAQVIHAVVSEEATVHGDWTSPHQSPVPADLRHFVLKGLQKDPAKRYATVHEMLERLERRAAGDIPCECPVTLSMQAMNEGHNLLVRHPMLASGALMVLLLTGVASMVYSAVHLLRA
ncbi:MAG: serine/threonine protein kinase [Myxococcales bacterium]|nr:MAG: serine/threonine protein kinase [Myxococcales bacterium]